MLHIWQYHIAQTHSPDLLQLLQQDTDRVFQFRIVFYTLISKRLQYVRQIMIAMCISCAAIHSTSISAILIDVSIQMLLFFRYVNQPVIQIFSYIIIVLDYIDYFFCCRHHTPPNLC